MCLPVTRDAQRKKVVLFAGDTPVADFVCRLDTYEPEMYMYIDLKRFQGRTFDMRISPAMKFRPTFLARIPTENLYGEKYRPTVHFTSALGWINDPNGLCYYGGKYHLFYQHNPAGIDWGNMHWGHAESRDLLHWRERETALFPTEMGPAFTGCAVIDKDNISGLKDGEHDPLLLFYTAAGGNSVISKDKTLTQCLVYSTDGGRTFIKYDKNPIVDTIHIHNRDPKVVYNKEEKLWYMALYITANRFEILTSKNLLDWQRRSEISLGDVYECPNLYPLEFEGETYWVFTDATDKYLVGKVKDGVFTASQRVKHFSFGKARSTYAAQVFHGIEDRTVRMSWNTAQLPRMPFAGSMCTPLEMSLESYEQNLCLKGTPVRELSKISEHIQRKNASQLEAGGTISLPLEGKAQDIEIDLICSEGADVAINVLGLGIEICPDDNAVRFQKESMPAFCANGRVKIRMITDVHAIEIYTGEGKAMGVAHYLSDYNLDELSLAVKKGNVIIDRFQSTELVSIHKTQKTAR